MMHKMIAIPAYIFDEDELVRLIAKLRAVDADSDDGPSQASLNAQAALEEELFTRDVSEYTIHEDGRIEVRRGDDKR